MSDGTLARDRSGFVMGIVMLMLFAIAIAGATGFQVVSSEFTLAQQNRDGQEALAVARAGLKRFLGEQVGQVGDSVSYAIGDGIATVTARQALATDSLNHLYYVRSVGEVADARTPLLPASRTVGTYVWHRIAPIPQNGALWISGGRLTLSDYASVDGNDGAPTGTCAGAGVKAGVAYGGTLRPPPSGGGYVTGTPQAVSYSDYSAFYDSVDVRWDILTDPNFPVDFDGYWPDFGSLPSDSFPVVRFIGDKTVSFVYGRGVLIVTGRITFSWLFDWDGIILAGELGNTSQWVSPSVDGMLIAGLNGSNPNVRLRSGMFRYHSCNAYEANRSLSYLEVVSDALVEINR